MTPNFASHSPARSCPLRALMAFERDRTCEQLDEFVARLEVDDRRGSLATWHRFETRLRRRLELEEELLLPAYAQARPRDAHRLHEEHEQLLEALRKLGAYSELNLLRAEHLRGLFKLLRTHLHHDDALYAWAEHHVDDELQRQLAGALQHGADDLNLQPAV